MVIKLKLNCVVQENIHTPPQKGMEIRGGGGCHRPRNFQRRGGGEGCCFDDFFSRPVSIFLLLYVMFRCLHLAS